MNRALYVSKHNKNDKRMKIHLVMILAIALTSCLKNSKVAENQKSVGLSNTEIIDQSLSNGTLGFCFN